MSTSARRTALTPTGPRSTSWSAPYATCRSPTGPPGAAGSSFLHPALRLAAPPHEMAARSIEQRNVEGGLAVDATKHPGTGQRDVFVSYAHENADWARPLAANLHESGLEVWFDEWDITAGARLTQTLQEGLASSRAVVLVVSAAAIGKEWWQEEFNAAMAAVIGGSQRLVPVLLDDVALPPFVAGRAYVDFRHVDSPDAYRAALDQLVRAVRNVPQADRPARGGGIILPPSVYRAEGPQLARLRITRDAVVFSTGTAEARHQPAGIDYG